MVGDGIVAVGRTGSSVGDRLIGGGSCATCGGLY